MADSGGAAAAKGEPTFGGAHKGLGRRRKGSGALAIRVFATALIRAGYSFPAAVRLATSGDAAAWALAKGRGCGAVGVCGGWVSKRARPREGLA